LWGALELTSYGKGNMEWKKEKNLINRKLQKPKYEKRSP